MPDNYWNAGISEQAFAYNGGVGLYPVHSRDDGVPEFVTGGKTLQALFPGAVLIGAFEKYPASVGFDVAERGLRAGVPLWWTRHVNQPSGGKPGMVPGMPEALDALLKRTGATVETYDIIGFNGNWLLQIAHR